MKLLLENFRKFLAEEENKIRLSGGKYKLFSGFRTDDDFWKYSGAFGEDINSPEELDKAVMSHSYYSNPQVLYNDETAARNLVWACERVWYPAPEDEIKKYFTLWFLIWGYVGHDVQPKDDSEIEFIRNCYKNSGEPELKFYTGTAYRGMMVPESWLYNQLFMQDDESDDYMRQNFGDFRSKEALAGKNYLNLYRLIRGEKVIEPQTKSGFWKHYPRGRAESWSRKLKVASDYLISGALGKITKHMLSGETGEYLSIILVADGTDRNADKFLDFEPLYKSTIASKEAANKEVPAFVKEDEGINVKKAIIPYREIKKLFDKAEELLQDYPDVAAAIKSGKLRPVQFENADNSSMLKEHKYKDLTKIEQDWEILF